MKNEMIDTHCHLYDTAFDTDRAEALARAEAADVETMLLPAIDNESYEAMFALARAYPDHFFPMMGLHPTSVNDNPHFREELDKVAEWLASPPEGIRFCAVGEVGLDFYWSRDYCTEQIEALRRQIELALQHDLPLVLHTRDAWDELCTLMEAFRGRGVRGILHSFSGNAEHYRSLQASGSFLIGIGGPVTYKKSALPELLTTLIPLEKVVLETDCPYLPPTPYRGKRNESSYLPLIAEKLATLYDTTPQEIARITTANTRQMFGTLIENPLHTHSL